MVDVGHELELARLHRERQHDEREREGGVLAAASASASARVEWEASAWRYGVRWADGTVTKDMAPARLRVRRSNAENEDLAASDASSSSSRL